MKDRGDGKEETRGLKEETRGLKEETRGFMEETRGFKVETRFHGGDEVLRRRRGFKEETRDARDSTVYPLEWCRLEESAWCGSH